jgi:hypothetical protein
MGHASMSYQNLFPGDILTTSALPAQIFERRKSTGWLDSLPLSPPRVEFDAFSTEASQSVDEMSDDGDARRALDEIESIHLRLLAEMSDDLDDGLDDGSEAVRRCRSVGCLATFRADDGLFDDRRSRSSCFLYVPNWLSSEEDR